MINYFDLIAAFLVGLGSSVHCMGMCGGIAAGFASQKQYSQLKSIVLFNFGRLLSYTILGGLAGFLVSTLVLQMSSVHFVLRILAGLMLISMGLYVAGWWLGLARLEKMAMPVWEKVQPIMKMIQRQRQASKSVLLGLLWGLLPCGLIYSTLIWASASGSIPQAAALMFFMGLGTLPTLVTISFVGSRLIKAPFVRTFSGLMLILYGIWTATLPIGQLIVSGQIDSSQHQMH